MRNYVSKLEGVDPERGDTMIFKWSDAISQLTDFPTPDKAGRVIQSFIRWGKGGAVETLPDSWENSVLKNMIEHQQSETHKYFRTCHNRERKEDGATYVETRRDIATKVVNETETKDNLKPKGKSSCLSVGDKMQNGLTPSALVPHSAEEAKKILAMDAPPIASHPETTTNNGKRLNADGNRFATGTLEAVMFSVGTKIYPDAINEVSVEVSETLQEVLDNENHDAFEDLDLPKSFFKTPLGSFVKAAYDIHGEIFSAYDAKDEKTSLDKSDDVFKRALLDAAIGSTKANVENRAGFILARLKKVAAAVNVLESMKAKKPLTDSDY